MDKQFVYLNFHTEYSSTGTLEKRMRREYCFSDVFYHDHVQNNKYVIRIYKGLDALNQDQRNNACFMTKDELFDYISIAKRFNDFNLKIDENEKMFTVHLELDAKRVVHRYVLTWLRYAYEFPFNVYLADAIRLKNVTGFKRDDLFNLFNLVSATSGYHFHGDYIHCIGDASWVRPFYTPKEQINILDKADDCEEVNDLFRHIDAEIDLFMRDMPGYEENMKCYEYWTDDKEFKKRLVYYKKNKTIIKHYKKKK